MLPYHLTSYLPVGATWGLWLYLASHIGCHCTMLVALKRFPIDLGCLWRFCDVGSWELLSAARCLGFSVFDWKP